MKTNSNGFRGAEINFDKEITILCLGASTTEGSNSDEKNTYPYHLQILANEVNKSIQIINLGHSGYTPKDIYNLYKFNLDLNPDIIIYFEGNGNGLEKKEVYGDENLSIAEIFHSIHKRLLIGRIIINTIPDITKTLYLDYEPNSFDLNNSRPSKEKYFFEVEKILDLSLEKNIVPILVTPINGWSENIQFSREEFFSIQNELNDYWPLTPKEIELFYEDYSKNYQKLASEKKVTLIDIENKFKYNKELFLNAENKLTDLHHLSPSGNKKLAELIFEELRNIIKDFK